MDQDDGLNVAEFEHAPHDFVDIPDTIFVVCAFFAFEKEEAEGNSDVGPSPEREVAGEGNEACVEGFGAEPAVGEVLGVEGKEDGVGEELPGCEAYGLGGRGVGDVAGREEGQGPTVDGDVLGCAHEHEEEPPSGEGPDGGTVRLAGCLHHFFGVGAEEEHANAREELDGQDPAFAPA